MDLGPTIVLARAHALGARQARPAHSAGEAPTCQAALTSACQAARWCAGNHPPIPPIRNAGKQALRHTQDERARRARRERALICAWTWILWGRVGTWARHASLAGARRCSPASTCSTFRRFDTAGVSLERPRTHGTCQSTLGTASTRQQGKTAGAYRTHAR